MFFIYYYFTWTSLVSSFHLTNSYLPMACRQTASREDPRSAAEKEVQAYELQESQALIDQLQEES